MLFAVCLVKVMILKKFFEVDFAGVNLEVRVAQSGCGKCYVKIPVSNNIALLSNKQEANHNIVPLRSTSHDIDCCACEMRCPGDGSRLIFSEHSL